MNYNLVCGWIINPLPADHNNIRFLSFYYPIKPLLLGIKWLFEHTYLQMLGLNSNKYE